VSYNRFVELMPRALVPLCNYLHTRKGRCTGITFVDSTPLAVCHNKRIARHKVFDGYATRGKCSMGWYFGFKLHLMVNDQGELLAFRVRATRRMSPILPTWYAVSAPTRMKPHRNSASITCGAWDTHCADRRNTGPHLGMRVAVVR
jgi:hypothetical protein